jgi:hypothetical protein
MENPKGVSYFIKKELPQLNFALIFLVFLFFFAKNTEGIFETHATSLLVTHA